MSRIGNQPVTLPKGVTVDWSAGSLKVKGPKGELRRKLAPGITYSEEGGMVRVARSGDTPQARAYHGLMRALLNNMVIGVTKGFEKKLTIVGVGYKAEVKGREVVLNLGYSHPIHYPFPDGVTVAVEKGNVMSVSGIDKERVGQAAAEIRSMRPPDSYKGKGVRYIDEVVRLKAGKSAQ